MKGSEPEARLKKIRQVFVGDIRFAAICDLDSGATSCFWGRVQFEEFLRAGGTAVLIELKYPFKVKVANHKLERCRYAVLANISIPFPAGEAGVRNAVIYLVEGPWSELLVLAHSLQTQRYA